MDRTALASAVEGLLRLMREPPSAEMNALVVALDALALSLHDVKASFDAAEHADPPSRNYAEMRAMVANRFPQLGPYNVAAVTTREVGTAECLVGDAIDDLADIVLDVSDFTWRREHTTQADAEWHLLQDFRTHWGDHLRALQYFLHRFEWERAGA